MSKILLIEGIPGAGKTTLTRNILKKFTLSKGVTLLSLGQRHTYGPLVSSEDKNTLIIEKNINHLNQVYNTLDWFISSPGKGEKFYCLIETLHITQCFRPGVISWNYVKSYDKKLSSCNFKLIFLKINKDIIWERTIEKRKNTPFIQKYAKKFGRDLKEIHTYFIKEQEEMEKLIEKSSLKKKIIFNNGDLSNIEDKAYSFWMA